jgi:hypothetical protein
MKGTFRRVRNTYFKNHSGDGSELHNLFTGIPEYLQIIVSDMAAKVKFANKVIVLFSELYNFISFQCIYTSTNVSNIICTWGGGGG